MTHSSLLSFKLTFLIVILGCTSLPLATLSFSFVPGTTYKFAYKTETSINQLSSLLSQSRPHRKDVGVKMQMDVEVTSVWSHDENKHHLIKLAANNVVLQGLSHSDPTTTQIKQLFKTSSFFLLQDGVVTKIFVPEEQKLSADIYRGIASLFQISRRSHQKETDVSGACDVVYEKTSDYKIVKSKKNCQNFLEYSNVNKVLGVKKHAFNQVEYSFSNDFILSIKAQQKYEVAAELGNMATVVSTRQQLSLLGTNPSQESIITGSYDQAVSKIKRDSTKLVESSLEIAMEKEECKFNCKKFSDVVEEARSKITPTSTGQKDSSSTFQALLLAFRSANQEEVTEILKKYKTKNKEDKTFFLALIDAACASQTTESLASLKKVLNFNKDETQVLERFLLAAALSTHPSQDLLLFLLELSSMKLKDAKLQESIQLSLGAVLHTYSKSPNHDKAVADEVIDTMLKDLSECGDSSSCQTMVVRSLSNVGARRSADAIMRVAMKSKVPVVGEACLKALRRFDVELFDDEFRDQLKDIFHQKVRGHDTVVRSQALKLLLSLDLDADEVEDIFLATFDPWNSDYNLYVQSRLFDEARKNNVLRNHLENILRNSTLANYHTLSPKGKSLAFSSEIHGSPKVNYMMYVENGRSGAMKRSGMDVDLVHFNFTLPLYKFEIFAAGLESMIGEATDESEDGEMTAGMSLDMIGVSLRPITFFVGQAGLMSAAWSAPSELMSALQINFLLHDHKECLILNNGLNVKITVTGVTSLDLSGSLTFSLWYKNSQSLIRNSGSLSLRSRAHLDTNLFQSSLDLTEELQSGIDFKTDVDFYDGLKMCLQMSRPDSVLKQQTISREWLTNQPTSSFSRSTSTTQVPAISYILPRSNNDLCRMLFLSKS